MTSAQVVETSVTFNNNSPKQELRHPDDQTPSTFEMTPGLKPFTVLLIFWMSYLQGIFPSKTIDKPFLSCTVIWFLPSNRSLDSNEIQRLDDGIFSNMAQLREL